MRRRIAYVEILALIVVGARTAPALPAFATVSAVPGDPLTGLGAVSRSVPTSTQLTGGTSAATVSNDAFALPAAAKAPTNQFEGTITLNGVATTGSFTSLKDPCKYRSITALKRLPPVTISTVQNGSYLIPSVHGV